MNTVWPTHLVLAASLGGEVRAEEDLSTVYDATISLIDSRLRVWQVSSGISGRFEFTDLPPGTYRLHISPPHHENLVGGFLDAGTLCEARSWTLDDTDAVDNIQALLPSGGILSGTLLDSDGQAMVDAPVWAIGTGDTTDGRSRYTTTDDTGHFSLVGLGGDDLGSGEWSIWVDIEDWPRQYLGPSYDIDESPRFVSGPGTVEDIGEHHLLSGIQVEGSISGPDGAVPDATVHVYAGGQVVTVQSDDEGEYRARGLPTGDVLPWASMDGLSTTYYPNVDRPTEFLQMEEEGGILSGADIVLPRESILEIRLADADSDEPASGLSVLLYNDTHTVGRGDQADENGVVQISRLHPGNYELYVWGASLGLADDWVRDEAGEIRSLSISGEGATVLSDAFIEPAALLRGHVRDLDGAPIANAWVIARSEGGESTSGTSDDSGTFALSGMNADSWTVEARVTAACPGDAGFVSTWWPNQVNEDWAPRIPLRAAELRTDLEIRMPFDNDNDGMGDEWEDLWSFDLDRNDAAEDADGDGYRNLTEYLLNTNPREGDRGCSSAGVRQLAWAWLFVIPLILRRP